MSKRWKFFHSLQSLCTNFVHKWKFDNFEKQFEENLFEFYGFWIYI